VNVSPDGLAGLRRRLDEVFRQGLVSQDKGQATHVWLDDALLNCFSTLSPNCRDEELEDLTYFILDPYQFHGVQVAIVEVDVDQVVLDLRAALEEHAAQIPSAPALQDAHMFLMLDGHVQDLLLRY